MSEPPDRRRVTGTFSVAFTVVNQGRAAFGNRSRLRFYLVKKAGKPRKGDRRLRGSALIGPLRPGAETSRRIRVRIPLTTRQRLWFLVGCTTNAGAGKSRNERNNCRVSGQRLRILPRHAPATISPPAGTSQFRIDRTTLPIGRPTIAGVLPDTTTPKPGDAEKSNQRKEIAKVGPVHVVADCKRTTNGDAAGPDVAPSAAGAFDEDGDEAKVLIYTDDGTVTFNSLGASSRRNIGPGEGGPVVKDTNGNPNEENTGGEGKHMALAAARDPDQGAPENDWKTAYKVGSIYISHSNGTEFVFTGYAAIDTLGVGDNCAFGGVVTVVKS
jgi:hypothetical protein